MMSALHGTDALAVRTLSRGGGDIPRLSSFAARQLGLAGRRDAVRSGSSEHGRARPPSDSIWCWDAGHQGTPREQKVMAVEFPTTVAIQVGGGRPEIIKDVSAAEATRLVAQKDQRIAARLEATDRRLRVIREEVMRDPDRAVEYYALQLAQSRSDQWLSGELEGRSAKDHTALIDRYHRTSSLGTVLLYKDVGFNGSVRLLSVTWPNLTWWPYRFDDVASSAKAWGINRLFRDSWYRGKGLWLVGLPYFETQSFAELGFDDVASSFVGD